MKAQTMKTLFGLLCTAAMLTSMTACGKKPAVNSDGSSGTSAASTSAEANGTGVTETNGTGATETSGTGAAAGSTTAAKKTTQPTSVLPMEKRTNLTRDQVIAKMPAKLRNTTIKYMTWDNPKQAMEKDAIADFEKKTGIKIEVQMVALDKKYDILASRVAAGNSPDLFRMDEAWPFVCKNLQPIQNLGYNFNDKAWDWDLMSYFTYDGRTYSMQLADTPFTPVAVLYYNKAALRKAEMDDMDPYQIWKKNPKDWTWSKFFSLCDTFLSRNGNKDGYYGSVFSGTYIYAYPRCFGLSNVNYNTKTGKYESMVGTSAFVKRMETLADAIQKKYISDTAQGFEMGQVLFAWDWAINAQANNIYYGNLKKSNNLGIVPIPTDSTKQVLYQHMGHGVPVGAKNGAAVPYFIRYIQDRKGYNIDAIYSVPNSAEVTEWSIEQGRKNKSFFVGDTIHNYNFISKILISPGAQVKSICDTYAPEFATSAKDANNTISGLPH